MEFNLHHKDLEWPEYCPILGVKLERGGDRSNSPSLDRIDPSVGYVKGNVRVISKLANGMKQNATFDELEMFSKNILKYMKGEI